MSQFTGSLTLVLRILSEGIVTIAVLILLASINALALGMMTGFGIIIFVSYDRGFRKRVLEAGRLSNLANQRVIRGVQEAFSGLKEVRILGRSSYFLDSVVENSRIVAKWHSFNSVVGFSPRYLVELAIVLFVVVLVLIVFIQTGTLENSYALIGMFGVASLRLGPSITMIISSVVTLRNQRHGVGVLASDLREFIDHNTQARSRSRPGSWRSNFPNLKSSQLVLLTTAVQILRSRM